MGDANGGTTAKDVQRRRSAALRALAQQRRVDPADLDEALRVFGGERELLLAAHQRWQVTLLARLDMALELGTGDVHEDVRAAVTEVARVMPGLAALLRAHGDDPVLATARRRLADQIEQACPCGRPHEPVPQRAPARRPGRCVVVRAGAQVIAWGRRHLAPVGGPPGRRALCTPALGR